MGESDTLLNAVIGAAVTVVFSFTAISPVLGGAVAGYLQQERPKSGMLVGALSGLLAFLPFIGVIVLLAGVFLAIGLGAGIPGSAELLIIFFVIFPLVLAWNVGLGAAGGYLGVYLREETDL